jgi:phage terminase large subunit
MQIATEPTPQKPDMNIMVSSGFLPLFVNKYRHLVSYGGAGSGKSEAIARKVFHRCWHEGNHRILITRKTRKSLKDSTWEVMLNLLEEYEVKYYPNKSDLFIKFRSKYGDWNTLLFYGLDDTEKLKSIKGLTMIWVEEATEISEKDFVQLDLRLRDPTPFYKQIIMTFNPDETKALWLKKKFFGELPDKYTGPGKKANSYLHHSTLEDNPIQSVREEYKSVLLDLDETHSKIYRYGIWAAAKGRIFFWPEKPLPSEDENWYDDIFFGVDFGFSINEAAYIKVWRKGLVFWLKELIYEKGLTNPQFAQKISAHEEANPDVETYCDSAEPKSIQELEDEGIYAVEAIKGPDSVKFGYDILLSTPRKDIPKAKLEIYIVRDTSPNLVAETRDHKWAEDRYGNLTGKPVDFRNHLISAARYAIITHYLKYLRIGQSDGKVSYQGMPKPKVEETEEAREERLLQQAKNHTASKRMHPQASRDKKEKESKPTIATTGGKSDQRKGKVYVPWR